MESFKLLHTALFHDRIPICEYVSTRTGLTVIIAEAEGPTVSASFHILTEAFDDDGLPNALRYLILMGSEDYPYKNIPKLIATSSLGSEVNSQIKTIHTTYTVETIANEGLLSFLPIIGDYILFPLLTEEAFTTEIHHITENGEDAGVMYEDLKSAEESSRPRLLLFTKKNIYPGRCSYGSDTRGTRKRLRESVTITKVRDYHKEFYRPENLKIVIIGDVKPEEVFKALEKLEEKVISKGPRDPFNRPFQTLPPRLGNYTKDLVIRYPADTEEDGYFSMAWRTVSCITDSYNLLAITMLLEYLTESPLSRLQELVQNENLLVKDVEYDVIRNKESCVYLVLSKIPLRKLAMMKSKIEGVFKEIIEYKDINMDSLKAIIKLFKLKQIINLENFPDHEIHSTLINYMAFGTSADFQHCLNPLPDLDKLLEQRQSFWLDLVQKYFVQNEKVTLQFTPSKEEKETMINREEDRLKSQRQSFTESELNEKGEILKKAIAFNERKPPSKLLISIPFPNIDSIKHLKIERYNSATNQDQRIDLSKTPVFTYFDNLNVSTVFLQAFLDTSDVPADLQNYLPLLFECLMDLPIERDGVVIPPEDVAVQLDTDLIYRWTDPRAYSMPHLAVVCVEVDAPKFKTGIRWLRELVYKTVFTVEILRHCATRILRELTRDSSSHDKLHQIINAMCFSKDNYLNVCGRLQQKKFLTDLIEKLDSNSSDILENIEKIRRMITAPSKVTLYIAANLDCLKDPVDSIDTFLPPELNQSDKQQKLSTTFNYNYLEFHESLNGVITGDADTKDPICLLVTKAMTSYIHPDYAALSVYIKYLDQMKESLCKQLQTHFWLNLNIEEGLLYLNFSMTKNIVDTYKKAKEVFDKKLEPGEENEVLLKSAQKLTLNELIEGERSIMDLVLISRTAYFHNLDYTFRRTMYESVTKVTIEDLNSVKAKYLLPLFDPKKSKIAIVDHPSRIIEVADEYKKLGLDLKVYNSEEQSFLHEL